MVIGNRFDGDHLRHAVLLQFPTHNNLVADNEIDGGVLDAIDLHGEGEYLNEIRGNRVRGVAHAAIGLGNGGGSTHEHDASGPGNWVHGNELVANDVGVVVMLGTPDTVVERNVITDGRTAGIELRNAPGTVVRGNMIVGNDADGFWAIRLREDDGSDGRGEGEPTDVRIEGNVIARNDGGIRIDAGSDVRVLDNELGRNEEADLRVDEDAQVSEN